MKQTQLISNTKIQQLLNNIKNLDYSIVSSYLSNRIKNYIELSNKKGGIIGLSGGVDSAVTTMLLANATKNFYILLMPSSTTPKKDIEDSLEIIRKINAENKYTIINIDDIVEKISYDISTNDKLIIGNIKARIRMTLLYAYAQKLNYLVIGTGDKSELLLGYFTKYGDGGVDVLPIGDLYKTQVRELAKYLNLPDYIAYKPSSPALWEGQTAENEIGLSYETIDAILYLRVEQLMTVEEISSELNLDINIVSKIDTMIRQSQHKRLPPEIFRLSGRAINSDWRYPRQWT
ncbi:NAD(+) synthetase [Acidianus manzaensis]|uniref:NH(3)-dependent NAD(+) synthetase n=1 Tax=Acidianus manzaensis TaxID=282676 RepID=A0A1W6JXN4_9CREN|nr:NAD+ synthase [Acidianus manzaensis]ARM74990.1 NAD(+) synthetase [Acidianus manzaensis]